MCHPPRQGSLVLRPRGADRQGNLSPEHTEADSDTIKCPRRSRRGRAEVGWRKPEARRQTTALVSLGEKIRARKTHERRETLRLQAPFPFLPFFFFFFHFFLLFLERVPRSCELHHEQDLFVLSVPWIPGEVTGRMRGVRWGGVGGVRRACGGLCLSFLTGECVSGGRTAAPPPPPPCHY